MNRPWPIQACPEPVEGPGFGLSGEQHFWQKRYYDFNIRSYSQFVEKLRYIHRNPVKAGLRERPECLGVEQFSSLRNRA